MKPGEKLRRAEAYIAELEAYIESQYTCVVCSCLLFPNDAPPHCQDTCHPDPETDELPWVYLDDPVKQLRKKHGRA